MKIVNPQFIFCGREGTITHISVGLIHKNLTDFLHSARRAEAGRALSSDTPWRAEAGVSEAESL